MEEKDLKEISIEVFKLLEKHNLNYFEGLSILEATKGFIFYQATEKEMRKQGLI